jgi:hypothetical protein
MNVETVIESILLEARVRVVKARVRGGKVQRRKKVSNVAGYKIAGGKLQRMSASEKLKRRRAGKVAARKSKSKQARAMLKRKRSLQKRKSLGL